MKTQPSQKTVLVLEDERPLLTAINEKLTKSGFKVISARSVEQAFDANIDQKISQPMTMQSIEQALMHLVELEHVDAIWLDHSLMGDEDGLDFVKKFKANGGRLSTIPIFVVSNNENEETLQSYMSAGVSKYFIKSNHRLDEIVKELKLFLHP